jgi:hypothetical protein
LGGTQLAGSRKGISIFIGDEGISIFIGNEHLHDEPYLNPNKN